MLYPPVADLLKNVDSRYLLVNVSYFLQSHGL